MKMVTKSFSGANVFLSRNLVPPEIFDSVHDSLKQNGAEVFLCCDPSRSGIDDYHVISSPDHEKFEDLKAKGCNLLGPQCVLFCAKENRAFPKQQGFTCCLAMEGVKVLASGFNNDEKVKIKNLVTAMGGVFQTRASLDINFVIVKNVVAGKYKWALNTLKKPIVSVSWLYQCWCEHRIVPQELYRMLPFSGLTICITRISADARKEMQKLIVQNGGIYSADLTKMCTHLVSDAPEGDKYKVARMWGHIHIVTRRWLDQSISRKACLDEDLYSVQGASISSSSTLKHGLKGKKGQDEGNIISQSISCPKIADLETSISVSMPSTLSESTIFSNDGGNEAPTSMTGQETTIDSCVADDSQSEDNGLYLSDCRILLVGFSVTEMRKLVSMVRRGGGSRYMSFSERLTHIVVGTPSESEKKELRLYASSTVINVVNIAWLADCDQERKEVSVSRRHIISDGLPHQDLACSNKAAVTDICGIKQGKNSVSPSSMPMSKVLGEMTFRSGMPPDKSGKEKLTPNIKDGNGEIRISSSVFKGLLFRFSSYFPPDRRAEIVEWINQGGGEVEDDKTNKNVQFTIECHGLFCRPSHASQTTFVSSHWIRSSLEGGRLLDVASNILYSPLPCRVPLPSFGSFRFCISQYEERDRTLLRNLCFVLGAKFTEKLSKKVTHLLCKFTSGPKYEAAFRWGIQCVTSEWISECIRQDAVASMDAFRPKEITVQDQEVGLYAMSQWNTQAARMVSMDVPSQLSSQSQSSMKLPTQTADSRDYKLSEEKHSVSAKRLRLSNDDSLKDSVPPDVCGNASTCKIDTAKAGISEDVATVIEDLLAQSNKIQGMKSLSKPRSERIIRSAGCSMLGQDHIDLPSAVLTASTLSSRDEMQDDGCSISGKDVKNVPYGGFSETQTESQVVGYEQDLSGIQMMIERVKTRSSLT